LPGGAETATAQPIKGQLCIRFDQALASNASVAIALADTPLARSLLGHAPIYKRTYVTLNLAVQADQLFMRRRRTMLLHTRIPDIMFDNERNERVADLRQALADNGFWVYEMSSADGDDDRSAILLLQGICSANYRDIHMLVGVRYEPSELTRQLRYKQHVDSKTVRTGALETRFVLWGNGPEIGRELARLQVDLSQLIQDRLNYLRSA
jgi:hypothetical protein